MLREDEHSAEEKKLSANIVQELIEAKYLPERQNNKGKDVNILAFQYCRTSTNATTLFAQKNTKINVKVICGCILRKEGL